MTTNWPRQDFPALAPNVRVPVQFSAAEHERVWRSDADAHGADRRDVHLVAAIRDQRAMPGTGHNMSLIANAAAYHGSVLSFVEECVVAQRNTSEAMEAG